MENVDNALCTSEEQAFANGYSAGYAAGRRSAGIAGKWYRASEELPACEEGFETRPLFFIVKGDDKIQAGYFGKSDYERDEYFRTYRSKSVCCYDASDVECWAWQPSVAEVR